MWCNTYILILSSLFHPPMTNAVFEKMTVDCDIFSVPMPITIPDTCVSMYHFFTNHQRMKVGITPGDKQYFLFH